MHITDLDRPALQATDEWLEANKEAIAHRLQELKEINPDATVLPPGYHETLDGRRIFNPRFLILGPPGSLPRTAHLPG